jgi:hypothetical protein
MNPDGRQRRLSDITLEQYLLGELPEHEMVETKRALDEDPESRARLAALERSNREILERYPPDFMGRKIQSKLEQQEAKSSRKLLFQHRPTTAWVGAAAALILLFYLLPPDLIPWKSGTEPSTERFKGQGPQLKLYRKTRDGSEALADGDRVFQGDVLRIGYLAAGSTYGVIGSVDGRGTVTLHLPDQGHRSVRLKGNGQALLDFALELDDAPRWERFYFVTNGAPFETTPVLRALEQIDTERPVGQPEKLVLPKGLDQFVISLEKGTRQ